MSDLDKQLPKANALMDKIESGENWEPCMSRALEASLRIPEMCRLLLGKGEKSGSVGGTIPTLETGSLLRWQWIGPQWLPATACGIRWPRAIASRFCRGRP